MLKLVFGSKNKIVKLEKPVFNSLYALIKQSFAELPPDFTLSYLDLDKDEISLNSDEDLTIMLSSGVKMNKIYIKQSLSQVIEITDQIEPSFEVYESSLKKAQPQDNPSEQILIELNQPEKVEEKVEVQHKPEAQEPAKQEKKIEEVKVEIIEEVKEESKAIEVIPEKVEVKVQEPKKKEEDVIPQLQSSVNADIVASQLKETIAELVKKEISEKYQKIKQEIIEQKPKQQAKLVVEGQEVLKKKGKALIFDFKNEPEPALVYHGVICSECRDEYGIIGVRYQCVFCEGFNLCEKCEGRLDHAHSLVKVKVPSKMIKKEAIIQKYRSEIFKSVPANHYVPSISKEEVKRYIQLSQKTINDSYQNSKRYMNEMFQKLEMSHKNPYEVARKVEPVPYFNKQFILKQKIQYLMDLFGITTMEAQRFSNKYHDFTKEQLADLYVKER